MAGPRKTNTNNIPLIIENHPSSYGGYPFITLIQYRKELYLTIVDNVTENEISVYVLDLCGPENVDEHKIIHVASEWYDHDRDNYPVSIEFSKRGLTKVVGKIFRTYNIDFITRVIGPIPSFNMTEVHSVKRRKKKTVPPEIQFKDKTLDFPKL